MNTQTFEGTGIDKLLRAAEAHRQAALDAAVKSHLEDFQGREADARMWLRVSDACLCRHDALVTRAANLN